MGATTALLAVSALSTGYMMKTSHDAQKKAEGEMKRQEENSNRMMQEQKDAIASQKSEQERALAEQTAQDDAIANRNESRARLKSLASSKAGRAGTILTGPSGVTDIVPDEGRKSLLGG